MSKKPITTLTPQHLKRAAKIIDSGFSGGLSMCDLGSCQYNSISESISVCQKLRKIGFNFQQIASFLGYQITGEFLPIDEVFGSNKFIQDQLNENLEAITNYQAELKLPFKERGKGLIRIALSDEQIEGWISDCKYQMDELNEQIREDGPPSSIGECFNHTRDAAWDLWSAIPHITDIFMPTYKITEGLAPKKDKSKGPVFNMMNWDENIKLGIQAAILLEYYPSLSISDLSDFDT